MSRLRFNYSISHYPRTVNEIMAEAIPWTVGLLGTTTVLSFTIGTFLGALLAWPRAPRSLRLLMPPLWALGHHQCRFHDYTDEGILQIGRTYRERDIPLDVLWLDIGYMNGYRVFTWDETKFPDVPAEAFPSPQQRRRRGTVQIAS